MHPTTHRVEDERLITGRGTFTDDIEVPGALWAAFARSPHAHAEIVSIDAAAAEAVPGARLVMTGADWTAAGLKTIPVTPRLTDDAGQGPRKAPWPVLANERVRHVGECVALCVAETKAAAEAMAEAVTIDYRPLAAVVDVRDARADGAPQLWPSAPGNVVFRWGLGDQAAVEAAFQRAAHVVAVERISQRVIVCPMEPRAGIATYDAAAKSFALEVGNQGMVILRDHCAEILGVDKHSIAVTSRDVGGGFGIKNGAYPEYPAIMHAARTLGRPVRWNATRSEAFLTDAHARDSIMRGRMALDTNGRILAIEALADAAMGAYMHPVGYFIACANFARCIAGPYRVPVLRSETTCVMTNTMSTAPYRGAGRPEAAYLTESLMEAAAAKLGLDPVEIRRRNLLVPADLPHKTAVGTTYDSGDFPRLLDTALATIDWAGAPERKRQASAKGLLRGVGIGLFVEISGGVPNERAQMRLLDDGRIHVRTVLGATGQGHETVFAIMVAEQLGIAPDRIVIGQGDSRGFEDGGGSSASRSTTMGGLAMRGAAIKLVEEASARAAERFQVAPDLVVYQGGRFTVPGTNNAMGFEDLAADRTKPLLFTNVRIEAEPTFPNGCHIAEVEIDPETGAITIAGYVAIDDCGRVIHHELAEGQVHGSLAQGIGQALLEHGHYDPETGQLIAGSFMDYTLPRAADLPRFTSVLQPSPAKSNPLGVKGLGEGGTVGALPALSNAILDALRPLGVRDITFPATPHRIWRAIEDARGV